MAMQEASTAWQALMHAGEALERMKNAMFVAQELRQSYADLWETNASSSSTWLSSIEDARTQLAVARERGEEAIQVAPLFAESTRLSDTRASLHRQYIRIHADTLALELQLESDRMRLILYDTCVECEKAVNDAHDAYVQAQDDPSTKDAWTSAQQRAMRLLTTLQQAPLSSTHGAARERIARVQEAWYTFQPRTYTETNMEALTQAIQQDLSLHSPPHTKRQGGDTPDARKRRISYGTPSRLPRTPSRPWARTPSHSARRPSTTGHIRTERSVSVAAPVSTPRWTGTMAPRDEVDSPSVHVQARPKSAMDTHQSSQPRRVSRHDSMLPRLARSGVPAVPPIPAELATPSPATPHLHRSSSRVYTPNRMPAIRTGTPSRPNLTTPSRMRYEARDALDLGVRRICEARGVRVDRLDTLSTDSGDLCHRYHMFSKTVVCRLLRMVRAHGNSHNSIAQRTPAMWNYVIYMYV